MRLLAFLCIGLVWIASINATVGGCGRYTVFYPKKWLSNGPQPELPSKQPSKRLRYDKETAYRKELIVEEFPAELDGSLLLRNLFASQPQQLDKHSRIAYKEPLLVLSLAAWPIGWNHYSFLVQIDPVASEDDLDELRLTSGARGQKALEVAIRLTRSDEGGLYMQITASSNRMSAKERAAVLDALRGYLLPSLRDTAQLATARHAQLVKHSAMSKEARSSRRSKELDRIIHPEKYKHKASTVRPAGSAGGGGGGRYTPSAAAQARRQVRKGG